MGQLLPSSFMNLSLLIACSLIAVAIPMQKPVIQLVENEAARVALLPNGGFERLNKGMPEGWSPYEGGCRWESESGRNRTAAVAMESLSDNRRLGIRASLHLNQKT